MTKREIAMEYFSRGYNCAQAVLLAYKEECGLPEDALAKIALPFGGGISRLRSVCGSVSGMIMAYGLICGESETIDAESKGRHYAETQKIIKKFQERNGSYICGELLQGIQITSGAKPEDRTETYYKKRPCKELVGDAAEILEEYLQQ